ncbi:MULTISPECIES: universal stress protein [Phenylobacterium]|uniref:Universal stress protein n=1 Tax=Phenylobacterium koreense TaxID=266125 RepID=A0ABV2EHG8_9CAUL
MPGFTHILVTVDIEDPTNTERELKRAREIAEASGARITLVNVRTPRSSRYNAYLPKSFDADEQAFHEGELAKWIGKLGTTTWPVSTKVRVGGVAGEILAEARESEADLIIVGSHQPSAMSRLLGSNAERIVREARVSVLVAR